ncbi:trypsin-like peptidase domain-containing protein [Hymenobacter citatus]|nr:trypsin-like peptidase domain-containing protein [Hymenobacter citatus]
MRIPTMRLLFDGLCLLQLVSVSCTSRPEPEQGRSSDEHTAFFADDTVQTAVPTETPATGASGSIGNFVKASKAATPAVVHIKTTYGASGNYAAGYGQGYDSPAGRGSAMASGSGVLITGNGYIATNNHVVENASQIEVILPDNRQFPAKLVGRDPNTDLALLKIEADSLPSIRLGNSDKVQVGEWVVAVGYPFSLNTTVTAGIVSAKARSIGIINRPSQRGYAAPAGNTGIESFIQTDAAINPGNSGGALVNTDGELIGINSAIASQTGSYAGYAFAIPVNLARKILGDLRKYGTVKRGLLGVSYPSPAVEAQYLQQQGLQPGVVKGVYITGVLENSAAAAAGLQEGDIIQSIDGVQLNSSAEFSERIARHRPGDEVKLTYLRNKQRRTTSATLKGEEATATARGNASLEKIYNKLGASFAPVPAAIKQQLNLQAGVLVQEVRRGGFFDQVGIPSGTIIAFINGQAIDSPQDIDQALLSAQNGIIQVLAIAPDGSRVVFDFSLGT